MAASRGSWGDQAAGYLGPTRRLARLVIDDGEPAVVVAVDAVGAGLQQEWPRRTGYLQSAIHFGGQGNEAAGPATSFEFNEPAGDPLKARPPEGAYPGARDIVSEDLVADLQQLVVGVIRKQARVGVLELLQGRVHDGAALRRRRIGVERIERPEPENLLGVDRVGIAYPGLDAGHGNLAWAAL